MDFYFSKFKIVVRLLEDADLPAFKGAMLRGGFGVNLKDLVCINKDESCGQCFLEPRCSYSRIFESRKEKQTNLFYTIDLIPRPFVIETPLIDRESYGTGENIDFYLTVIGDALEHTPFLIAAFLRFMNKGIGKERVKAEIEHISYVNCTENSEEIIFEGNSRSLLGNYKKKIEFCNLAGNLNLNHSKIKINFITMTRLVKESKVVRKIEFQIFKKILLRRISMLYCYYCGDKESDFNKKIINLITNDDNVRIVEDKTFWKDWKRYSTRQKRNIQMGGILGEFIIEGDFTELLPYILLGQYIHIGKNCTFGLGKYEVSLF